jgi:hypothetical protein
VESEPTRGAGGSRLGLQDWLKHWRLILTVVLAQAIGGLAGVVGSFHYSAFHNSWLGGVLAAPVGFVAGLLWQYASAERRRSVPAGPAVFVGLLVLAIAAMGLFFEGPHMAREMELLGSLRGLDASDIERIEVFDEYGERRLATIDAAPAIAAFAAACRDVEGYLPNHPSYSAEWYLRLVGTAPGELLCQYESGHPGEVVGDFVTRRGRSTRYYGSFRSTLLRGWFREHVPQPGP